MAQPQFKPWRLQKVLVTRDELVRRFPQTFCRKGQIKKPLKIGIFEDICAACPDLKAWTVKFALADYCSGPSYRLAVMHGGARVDLAGQSSEQITSDAIAHAIEKFSKLPQEVQDRWLKARDLLRVA